MSAEIQDVVKINVVFVGIGLLNTPAEFDAFSKAVDADVQISAAGLLLGVPPIVPEPGRKLEIPRERITLDVSTVRSAIEREYPSEGDVSRLAEVAGCAVQNTAPQERPPAAFGYNIEIIFNQTSGFPSLRYLGDRLFHQRDFGTDDWNLVGGTGRLIFDSVDGRWTIHVEPRYNSDETHQVFVSLNLHKAEQRLPNADEIRQSFSNVWNGAHTFITRFDEIVS